jgi:branched-chain amino acid transport system ATP-binding protein
MTAGGVLLSTEDLTVAYGQIVAVRDLSVSVEEGEIVTLLGPNGAGKTTTLSALVSTVPVRSGRIRFAGQDITAWSSERIVRAGLTLTPEGRRIFGRLTVDENLALGASTNRDRAWVSSTRAELLDRFPILAERSGQLAGSLSGGEQQQLAVARSLLSRPRLLLLDEPSLGLAPKYVQSIFDLIRELPARGTTVLLVEQNVHHALAIADRAYLLSHGGLERSGPAATFREAGDLGQSYLGLGVA